MENEVTEIAPSLQQAIPGCGFRPTEEELLINYLTSEAPGWRGSSCIVPTLDDIYQWNPWDLPAKFQEKSEISSADQQWWFIWPQMQNQRISRKTLSGFSWKITGKHKDIKARNGGGKIGSKITLVFLDGRNSKGAKSNWVMHELHPHPDNTGFVLCWLKRKQDEKADNQEPSIQVAGNQSNDSATAKNEDIPSIPQFQCPEVVITELSKKVYSKSDGSCQNGTKSLAPIHEDNHHFSPDQEHIMWTKYSSNTANSSGSFLAVSEPSNDDINFPHPFLNVDVCSAFEAEEDYTNQPKAEMSGTSKFIGEQADKGWVTADCENSEQLPFAENPGCRTAVTKEWSWIEPWMSPRDRDSFPNGEFFDLGSLISEPEAEIGEIQVSIRRICISILELKHFLQEVQRL
ncbi:NAC domain-containing protein 19-like [Rhodamnia argentea]|uniref:NAC domain-containing protein 19-like n=1 Tax=Rhodamnia argentea TaxID=178133 RepID=A0ABM3HG88_9MYRT|nr:NAC domain-containing protein 19-like [Rhodamnia argentea]